MIYMREYSTHDECICSGGPSEGLDTSKFSYEVSKSIGGEILRILRILEDSLGIPWDS